MYDETQNLTNETTPPENEEYETENNSDDMNSLHQNIEGVQEKSEIESIENESSTVKENENKKRIIESRKVFINGERKYSCKTCGQLFAMSGNLKRHERIHSGEKPYQCNYCDKRFSYPQSHSQHERTHTGERPYKCKLCSKTFSQMSTLSNHKSTHSEEKAFECDSCPYRFKTKPGLIYHKKIIVAKYHLHVANAKKNLNQIKSYRFMRELTQEKDHMTVRVVQRDSFQKLPIANISEVIVRKRHLNARPVKNVFNIQVVYGTT